MLGALGVLDFAFLSNEYLVCSNVYFFTAGLIYIICKVLCS